MVDKYPGFLCMFRQRGTSRQRERQDKQKYNSLEKKQMYFISTATAGRRDQQHSGKVK